MKRFYVLWVFLLFFISGHAMEPLFCTKEGTRLEYIRRDDRGEVRWYHIMTIQTVRKDVSGHLQIRYTSEILNKRRKPKYRAPFSLEAEIIDGNVYIDLEKSVTGIVRAMVGDKLKVTATGGKSLLPARLEVGDVLQNARSVATIMGLDMTVDVVNRKVVGKERLKTSLGDFDTVIVQEDKTEKGFGRNRKTTARTWYAPGLGMLRHDTYDQKGSFITSEVISSIQYN